MNNSPSINIAKKEIQKAILSELCKKDIITFYQYNNIIKKLDEDILKLKTKQDKTNDNLNMIVKIPIQ